MTLMAEARLIYLDSNLATGGRAGMWTHMRAQTHTQSNTGALTCSRCCNVKQRLYYYNYVFKFQGDAQRIGIQKKRTSDDLRNVIHEHNCLHNS